MTEALLLGRRDQDVIGSLLASNAGRGLTSVDLERIATGAECATCGGNRV